MPPPIHAPPPFLLSSTPYPIWAQGLSGPAAAMPIDAATEEGAGESSGFHEGFGRIRPTRTPVHFQSLPSPPGVQADRRKDLQRGPEPV